MGNPQDTVNQLNKIIQESEVPVFFDVFGSPVIFYYNESHNMILVDKMFIDKNKKDMRRKIMFEEYVTNTRLEFVKQCGEMDSSLLTKDIVSSFYESLEEHRECFEKCNNDVFEVCTYADNNDIHNVSVECMHCNEVIIDADVLFLEEE